MKQSLALLSLIAASLAHAADIVPLSQMDSHALYVHSAIVAEEQRNEVFSKWFEGNCQKMLDEGDTWLPNIPELVTAVDFSEKDSVGFLRGCTQADATKAFVRGKLNLVNSYATYEWGNDPHNKSSLSIQFPTIPLEKKFRILYAAYSRIIAVHGGGSGNTNVPFVLNRLDYWLSGDGGLKACGLYGTMSTRLSQCSKLPPDDITTYGATVLSRFGSGANAQKLLILNDTFITGIQLDYVRETELNQNSEYYRKYRLETITNVKWYDRIDMSFTNGSDTYTRPVLFPLSKFPDYVIAALRMSAIEVRSLTDNCFALRLRRINDNENVSVRALSTGNCGSTEVFGVIQK